MAFTNKNLSALCYGSGVTLWVYTTSDTAATVDTSGYFNAMVDNMRVGDWILVNSGVGGTPAYGIMIVKTNDGTTVDVSDATAFGATNTD